MKIFLTCIIIVIILSSIISITTIVSSLYIHDIRGTIHPGINLLLALVLIPLGIRLRNSYK